MHYRPALSGLSSPKLVKMKYKSKPDGIFPDLVNSRIRPAGGASNVCTRDQALDSQGSWPAGRQLTSMLHGGRN